MTRKEAIEMLKAKLECLTRDVSGRDDDCNRRLCGECHLNYDKGTMGEQKEYLRMSIEALERQPCGDCISREQAIRATYGFERYTGIDEAPYEYAESILRDLPPVMRILEPALDEMYIVSYFDKEVNEPVVTAFNNRDAAEACYETFKQEHDITAIDHVKVYKEFKILDNDERRG